MCVVLLATLGCGKKPTPNVDEEKPVDRPMIFAVYHCDAEGNCSSIDTFEEITHQLIDKQVDSLDWISDASGDSVVFQGRGEWMGVTRDLGEDSQERDIRVEWSVAGDLNKELKGHNLISPLITLTEAKKIMHRFLDDSPTLRTDFDWIDGNEM